MFVRVSVQGARLPSEICWSAPIFPASPCISFGVLFLVIEIAGALGKRYLGHYGVLIVSFAGGLVSSASTTAAALLISHGEAEPYLATLATVVALIANAVSNLPVFCRVTKNAKTTRLLALQAALVSASIHRAVRRMSHLAPRIDGPPHGVP